MEFVYKKDINAETVFEFNKLCDVDDIAKNCFWGRFGS